MTTRLAVAGAALALAFAGAACSGGGSTAASTGAGTAGSDTTGTAGTGGSGTGGAKTTASASSGTTGTGGTPATVPCAAGGAEVPTLTTCTTPDTAVVTVPKGCAPTVDGVIHAAEWMDGACFNVMNDMVVVVKYAGDSLYMATSGQPTCGCGMQFYFLPPGGQNFVVAVLDDPFSMNGDRSDFTLTGSGLVVAPLDMNIVTACPGNQPVPVRYEWSIPLATLGMVPGMTGQFQMAITHAAAVWPTGLAVDASGHAKLATGEPTWGAMKSGAWE